MADVTGGLSLVVKGLVVLLVGVGIAAGGGYLYQDARQATESAVEVEATVVSSEVVHTTVDGGGSAGSDDAYYPDVQYRYTYGGETYTSRNLCPGEGVGCDAAQNKQDRSEVEAFVSEYPEGETATVHVPPDEPANAYLVEGSSPNVYLILAGFGGIVGLMGVAVSLGGVKELLFG